MKWWCAATNTPWDWAWQPYPGVWVVVALLLAGYLVAARRAGGDDVRIRERVAFVAGVMLLWAALDWPLGPLGAGYLLTAHTAQYLVLTFAVPPLLIVGLPAPRLGRLIPAPLTHPGAAFVWFNLAVLATHLPPVVDELTRSQLGMFAINMAWLSAGLLFWWQVLAPVPALRPLSHPGRFLFVLINMILPTVPAAFMTFADYPIYGLFELAPRVGGIPAAADQQVAGLLMQVGGGFTMLGIATVLFFRWATTEESIVAPRG